MTYRVTIFRVDEAPQTIIAVDSYRVDNAILMLEHRSTASGLVADITCYPLDKVKSYRVETERDR